MKYTDAIIEVITIDAQNIMTLSVGTGSGEDFDWSTDFGQ